jgi:hypothetical protein
MTTPCVEHLRDKFHVIAVVSNPVRYSSRYRLAREFMARMALEKGIHFHVVELQTGARAFAITEAGNPYHVQLRTEDELWHKENLINLGIQNVARHWPDWQYVAWVDADVTFTRHDWVNETLQELQVNHWVQMFSQAVDLGPCNEALAIHQGFVYSYWHKHADSPAQYLRWHSGFAWAATREAITGVGGLIDRAILGSGDKLMAMSLIGRGLETTEALKKGVHPNYRAMIANWQDRAERYVKRDIGFVHGTILHSWHGRKKLRGYGNRSNILVKFQYDPQTDVYPDAQGVLRLEDHKIGLRDAIKHYFRSRLEDSCDLE